MPEMVEDRVADFYNWKSICQLLDIYPNRPKRNQARTDSEDDYKVGFSFLHHDILHYIY